MLNPHFVWLLSILVRYWTQPIYTHMPERHDRMDANLLCPLVTHQIISRVSVLSCGKKMMSVAQPNEPCSKTLRTSLSQKQKQSSFAKPFASLIIGRDQSRSFSLGFWCKIMFTFRVCFWEAYVALRFTFTRSFQDQSLDNRYLSRNAAQIKWFIYRDISYYIIHTAFIYSIPH